MVPVLAVGFQDLKKRMESQELQTNAHKAKLEEIRSSIVELERHHYLVTLSKLKEYQRRQAAVVHKVLQVSALESLILRL